MMVYRIHRHLLNGLTLFIFLIYGCKTSTHEFLNSGDCIKTVKQANKTYAVFDTSLCNHGMLHDKTLMTFYVKNNLSEALKSITIEDFNRIATLQIRTEVVFVNIIVFENESTFNFNDVAELVEDAFVRSIASKRFKGYQCTFYFLDEKKVFPKLNGDDYENLFSNALGIAPDNCELINDGIAYLLKYSFSEVSGCKSDSTIIFNSFLKPNEMFSEMIDYMSANKYVESPCHLDTLKFKGPNYRIVDVRTHDYSFKNYTAVLVLTKPFVKHNMLFIGRTIMGASGSGGGVDYFVLEYLNRSWNIVTKEGGAVF